MGEKVYLYVVELEYACCLSESNWETIAGIFTTPEEATKTINEILRVYKTEYKPLSDKISFEEEKEDTLYSDEEREFHYEKIEAIKRERSNLRLDDCIGIRVSKIEANTSHPELIWEKYDLSGNKRRW